MTNQTNGQCGGSGGGGGVWNAPAGIPNQASPTLQTIGSTYTLYPQTGAGGTGIYYSGANGIGSPVMQVSGSMDVSGDLLIKGQSLIQLMSMIEERLSIISNPNPRKLEKYAALKEAYEQYKLLEKLINDDDC